tara:strand:+ start:261 stop:620 length:360 start_codon:yes stop_codon:yes gene_type:complete
MEYTCNKCKFSTKIKSELKKHKYTHMKLSCECGKNYLTFKGYNKHLNNCDIHKNAPYTKVTTETINNIVNLKITFNMDKFVGTRLNLYEFIKDLNDMVKEVTDTELVIKDMEKVTLIDE